jgi:hypothetical protein
MIRTVWTVRRHRSRYGERTKHVQPYPHSDLIHATEIKVEF